MDETKEDLIDYLVKSKAYPVCSKLGKISFTGPKDKFFDKRKDEIIKKLKLKTKEDCGKIRELVKEESAKLRTTKPIKKWVKEDRPREMLIKVGSENVPLTKLLAIILRTGNSFDGSSAEDLARKLLDKFRDLRGMDQASVDDLCSIKGIGMAKGVQIKSALEIGKRFYRETAESKKRLSNVESVIGFVRDFYGPYLRDSKKEFFNIILLDRKNKVIDTKELTKGSVNASIVDPLEIVREATRETASSIILVHNHPSGEVDPSRDDIETTDRVVKACDLVNVRVLDHIIIGKNLEDYFSFMDKGLI
ncbi:MAG: DNA repair protein RadC [Candidatus Aenigmarchaeota archaeon]|nr:DNA repair protein RadC [Candidatus Aenigmarchaeota archaeon]